MKNKNNPNFNSGFLPTLINLKNTDIAQWIQNPKHVYIGRYCYALRVSSLWGNPFRISASTTREQAICKYEAFLTNNYELQNALWQLCNKELGCWCFPEPCHGQVLINAVKHMLLYDIDRI